MSTFKVIVPAGLVETVPTLASVLGQHQVSLMEFKNQFKVLSNVFVEGVPLRVKVVVKKKGKFEVILSYPSLRSMLEQVGFNKYNLDPILLYNVVVLLSYLEQQDVESTSFSFFGYLASFYQK